MEPASKHTRMVIVRGAGTLLGVLMLVAVAAASDSAIAGALFENPHWPRLDTMGTFLSIANVAGLGVLVVFAVGCYVEPIGRVILDGADQWNHRHCIKDLSTAHHAAPMVGNLRGVSTHGRGGEEYSTWKNSWPSDHSG